MKNISHILFVCTGNSCRSIMAEAYLQKRLQEEGLSIEVKSAGTLGLEGFRPTEESLKVLQDEDINTEEYVSKSLTKDFIEWADMILVMALNHEDKILGLAPGMKEKIYYLGNFSKENLVATEHAKDNIEVPDPIGRPITFYEETFDLIKRSIEGLIQCLKK